MSMKIDTPLGTLKAEIVPGEFPGIYIILEDTNTLLAVVEFEKVNKQIQTVVYKNGDEDEPSHIIKHAF